MGQDIFNKWVLATQVNVVRRDCMEAHGYHFAILGTAHLGNFEMVRVRCW